jgi:glycosyltransferase involved in cell wall biosynthesis
MRICFLDESLFAGGADAVNGARVQILALAGELASRGHQVSVLTGSDRREQAETPVVREGIDVYSFARSSRVPFLGVRAASRAVRTLAPDALYVRGRTYLAGVAAWERWRRGTGFVWASNAEEGCERWKHVTHLWHGPRPLARKLVRTPVDFLADLICDLGVTRADQHVNQTEYQAERLRAVHHRQGTVVRSLHTPPAGLPVKVQPPLVVWIGRLSIERGPEAFVDLARELSAVDCDFALIGPPSSQVYLDQVLARAEGLTRLRYVGQVPLSESWEWIAKAALLVNTSHVEGVSNALVQAWHCGTPTVTLHFDPDGLIEGNGVGFLSRDLTRLGRDVRRLVEDGEFREAMAAKARALAEREFSGRSVGAIYEAIFRRAVEHA